MQMRLAILSCLCLTLVSCIPESQKAQGQHGIKESKAANFEYKVVRFSPVDGKGEDEKYLKPDEVIPGYEKRIADLANSGWEYVGVLSGGDNSTKNRGYWNDTVSRYVLFRRLRE